MSQIANLAIRSSWTIDGDGRVARLGRKTTGPVYRRSGAINGRPSMARGSFQCVECQRCVKDILRTCKLCTECFRKACRRRARQEQSA